MPTLREKLEEYRSSFDEDTPKELLETISRSLSLLQSKDVQQHAIKVGDAFPEFSLNSDKNQPTSLSSLIKQGPLIVTFIRGGWCPYCILEMREWQTLYETSEQPFNFVAITPEINEFATQLKIDNHLSVPLLIDRELTLAASLGLVWQIDDDMKSLLNKWQILLEKRNCDNRYQLPVPATFVINREGNVTFRFIEEDYTVRAEPQDVINHYQSLQ